MKKIFTLTAIVSIIIIVAVIQSKNQHFVSNAFEPRYLNVGDIVAGMTVTAIEPARDTSPLNFKDYQDEGDEFINYRVVFSGEKTIRGTYSYWDAYGDLVLVLDQESNNSLPILSGYADESPRQVVIFGSEELINLGDKGDAVLEISEFSILAYPADYRGWYARVDKVVDFQSE